MPPKSKTDERSAIIVADWRPDALVYRSRKRRAFDIRGTCSWWEAIAYIVFCYK